MMLLAFALSLSCIIVNVSSFSSVSDSRSLSPLAMKTSYNNRRSSSSELFANMNRDQFYSTLKEVNAKTDSSQNFFTGGAFDQMDDQAIKIASRLRNVKALGWTKPPKRPGSTRPRHRAWGGETEKPVQLKPNYDESNPICVEKWLTLEDFYTKMKDSSPAADTVFVALAGGAAYAERDVVESKLAEWRTGNKFNEDTFLKSVQKGRQDLFIGWAFFFSLNATFLSCIVFPTSPLTKALENLIQNLLGTP